MGELSEGKSGITKLKEDLIALLDENDMDQIVYKQWTSTDRSTLETFCVPVEEFIEIFSEKLELLRPHSFIASQQAQFYSKCKTNLQVGEILVSVDIYSFILQDAAQGFHWNNSQATLHPFVAYFVDSGELRHLSYVIILDCLHHDTIAFYLFQKFFIAFLKKFLSERSQPKKIIYFLMVLHLSTKTERTFSICAITEMISAYQLSGIFRPLHMEKVLVMV